MGWLVQLFAGGFLSTVGTVLKPIFGFLNQYVDEKARVHIADNTMLTSVAQGTLAGEANADSLNAQVRIKEGPHSPWILCTIFGFMIPTGWHYWQVVLDSSHWIPYLDDWYLPTLLEHVPGSWRVAKLPGMFEVTEHAIINSLFVGATTMFTGLGIIKGLRR